MIYTYGLQAYGMHPTGVVSCLLYKSLFTFISKLKIDSCDETLILYQLAAHEICSFNIVTDD